jgi:drug/metabolite transporter (DMT)-like permease
MVWNDSRCAAQKEAYLKEVGDANSMYLKTGWNLGNGLNALQIRWMKDNEPGYLAKTAMFLSVPDYISMKMTSPSTAVVLMYIAPIIVMIISVLFMGEKLTLRKFLCVIGAFLGCALVTGVIGGIKFSVAGIIIGALSGITYSVYCIFAKIEMRHGDDALCATAYCFITAGILSLIFSNPVTIIKTVSLAPLKIIPVAILMGICVGALPYFLYTLASKKLSASTASAMATIEPLTGTIVSVTVFNEVLSLGAIIGIVLILGSVIVLSYCKD